MRNITLYSGYLIMKKTDCAPNEFVSLNDTKMARVKEILTAVKSLASEYYQLTKKPLGVTGEIAEFIVAEKLGLELVAAREPGYDAIRRTGEQIRKNTD
jgi:hypothetical protein